MQRIEILLISVLVDFVQGTTSPQFPNWQSSWISGGSDAALGEFPHQVSLQLARGNFHFCGGSIISNKYILTAAHCVTGRSASNIAVLVGTNELHGGGRRYAVSDIIIHRFYNSPRTGNDIALLKLRQPIVYSSAVKSITLPNKDEVTAPGTDCVFTGWGYTSNSATNVPNNLKKVQLKIISNSECQKYYYSITRTKICASVTSGKGTCSGDSGGPLVCGGKQVGILRAGGVQNTSCGISMPFECMYVTKYIDWIKQNAV